MDKASSTNFIIPNKVIVDFIDVIDHKKFRLIYQAVSGGKFVHPSDGSFLTIESLDQEAQARLKEKLMLRISPAKRSG